MSRRRGEFEHRTSIFEGAFRAWSHLGGLAPEDLEIKPASELDPLNNPIDDDVRLLQQRKSGDLKETKNPDGTTRREFPYEPLPRSGLAHPYVQAILSPWLGPDADNEAIQLGLTTLRTWWQHRRKGESGSAIAALGTEKMKGVVEGYMRHFFTLAHCLVVNDKEQPPRTLHSRMKELEKARNKKNKKKGLDDDKKSTDLPASEDMTESPLTPLERLHAAQRRQLAKTGMIHPSGPTASQLDISLRATQQQQQHHSQTINAMKGTSMAGGKMDLVPSMDHSSNNLCHRGVPITTTSMSTLASGTMNSMPLQQQKVLSSLSTAATGPYGDPHTTPVVCVSTRGDIVIALDVEGINSSHCVKIVETVLKGCSGTKSPIDGLLDAVADFKLRAVLIRIDKASNAKRIAFEAARNLSMVGYSAKAKEMSVVGMGADKKSIMDLGSLSTAFELVANSEPSDFFDWRLPCTCPNNGVLRKDCLRHMQMSTRVFEVFELHQKQVMDYMAGCGMKLGMACTCGPDCRCKNCPTHGNGVSASASQEDGLDQIEEEQIRAAAARLSSKRALPRRASMEQSTLERPSLERSAMSFGMSAEEDEPIQVEQKMNFFGIEPPKGMQQPIKFLPQQQQQQQQEFSGLDENPMHDSLSSTNNNNLEDEDLYRFSFRRGSQRNPSIISYGGLRHMSMNSETTFGRAMSGLSALSIDWENLEDFDLDVDHSAHINNTSPPRRGDPGALSTAAPTYMNNGRRSSFRRPHLQGSSSAESEAHVSFKV